MCITTQLKQEVQSLVAEHLANPTPEHTAMMKKVSAVELQYPEVSKLCPLNTQRLREIRGV